MNDEQHEPVNLDFKLLSEVESLEREVAALKELYANCQEERTRLASKLAEAAIERDAAQATCAKVPKLIAEKLTEWGMGLFDARGEKIPEYIILAKIEDILGEDHPGQRILDENKELHEQLAENNTPVKHFKHGGTIYAVYGTSSIAYTELLHKQLEAADLYIASLVCHTLAQPLCERCVALKKAYDDKKEGGK